MKINQVEFMVFSGIVLGNMYVLQVVKWNIKYID